MPAFARRRKGRTSSTSQLDEEPSAVTLLRRYEEQLAERVRHEQQRTGKERPQCFAVYELELVQAQIAAAAL